MQTRALRLLRWLLAHRGLVLAAFLLATLAMVPGVLRLETDNSPEVFYLEGSEALAKYRALRREFGSDEVMRIVAVGPGLWTAEGLAWLGETEEAAKALPGVAGASGLAGRHRWSEPSWPPADPEAFRRLALADPLARHLGWVDSRGEAATVLVVLATGSRSETREALAALRELTASPPADVATRLVGMAVVDEALDGSSREIQQIFFPLLVLFTLVLLALTFRDAACVTAPLVFVAAPVLLTLGPMGYLGVKLNLVLAVLPPLTFVIGLATVVHVLMRYRELLGEGLEADEAMVETYRDKGWAVLWTGVTTLVGFGSLVTSAVGPVKTLGLWSSVAIAVQTLAAVTLCPVLLASWVGTHWKGGRPIEALARRLGRRWAEASARQRVPLLGATALVALVAVAGLPRLAVESDALTYLPADHPVRSSVADLEARGIGTAAVELVLSLPDGIEGASFRAPHALLQLAALTASLRQDPMVLGAVGAGDVAAAGQQMAAGLAAGPLTGGFGRLAAQRALDDALAAFVSADGRKARLTLFVPVTGFDRLDPLTRTALETAREAFPQAAVEVTGQHPLLLETQRQLLATLTSSFALTLVCVSLILRYLVGNRTLALLALVPNVWPVLGVLGGMGWFGVPLDVATVMVASVLLGLAVYDTIHTLGHFRELAPTVGRFEAVASTLQHTAGAYVLTGVMLIAGFGVCALSSFAPTARFGLLSAAGIFLAVVGDLFLVPALLGGRQKPAP